MICLPQHRVLRSLAFAVAFACARGVLAQERAGSLADLSMEDLMNESVTSVSKKPTRLGDAPTAISVITQEDIRRSGYNSIPEVLRLVPGLEVARINGNEWAISSRGFNSQFAKKLLVLVDGRTVYTPSASGVYWHVQDMILEDVERIEVIRGPGAALWGANAVNGVINIITKTARDTQGVLISAAAGTEDTPSVGVRYGGELGQNVQYRSYLKYFDRHPLVDGGGNDVPDGQSAIRAGGRLDWQAAAHNDGGTLLADFYDSDSHKPFVLKSTTPPYATAQDLTAHNKGADILGNWTRSFSSTAQLTVQSYFQHTEENLGYGVEFQDSYDLDVQHRFALGERNDVVWGGGYRYTAARNTPTTALTWTPETVDLSLFQMFVQDEIALVPQRWHLVLGTKVEHNNLTGVELEPSARLLWTPNSGGTVWAAFSSATRTPSLFERGSQLNLAVVQPPAGPPLWIQLLSNPQADVENLVAYEMGYRFEPVRSLSFDVAAFYNVYHDLLTYVGDAPRFEASPTPHILLSRTIQNSNSARTYGLEVSAQWRIVTNWRMTASYTGLRVRAEPDPTVDSDSPQQQAQLRSYLDLPRHIEINAAVSYVDPITIGLTSVSLRIPSYVRVDLGTSWHPGDAFEVGVWGQNLLQSRHPEFPSVWTPVQVEIPRSAVVRLTWRF